MAIKYHLMRWGKTNASTLRSWWESHGTMVIRIAIAIMIIVALLWLGYQFWRLLWQPSPIWPTSPAGAVDLKNRYKDVHRWFDGKLRHPPYPPATYVILWPLVGWLPFALLRWFWAVTSLAALAWLAYLVIKESKASTDLERVFIALIPISMYATGATIGNGQLMLHILPCLITGLLLLHRRNFTLRQELIAVALLLIALVKPNASVPFLWIALFVPGRLRPALLVAFGYIALTLFSLSFQELPSVKPSPTQQAQESPKGTPGLTIPDPLKNISKLPTRSAEWAKRDRYSDIPALLITLGLKNWIIPVTLLILAAQGLWTYRNRHGDIWLLIGVAALVARFWTYHRWYDDLLILLPMVALFRIAKQESSTNGRGVIAAVLLAITLLATLAPGGLYLFPPPLNSLYAIGQSIVWIVILIFLLDQARYQKNLQHLNSSD
ncbi:MAG: hypothetical protein L0Y68_01990 [Candidatus Dadabacteria bacterium]|nr:hypothetical protein [Candidatus Dadabacteria bacterium]